MGAFLMANTYNEHNGTGSQDTFAYTFPYLKTTDVKVSVDGVVKQLTTDYTRPSVTTIQFNSDKKPANGAKVRIYRDTDEATANSTFYPGSAIKSSDLNDNFLQAIYIGEEGKENADDAWNKLEDSIDSTETWVSDNTKIGTTGAVDARVDSKINTELTNGSKNFNTSGTLAAGATTVTGNITVSGTVDGRDVAADGTKLDGIDTGAKDDQTAAEIKTLLQSSKLTKSEIADNEISESKLNVINSPTTGKFLQSQTGMSSGLFWADAYTTASDVKTALQSDKLTSSEIATGALDGRYYTETESDARYFNVSTGDTIKDGDAFPDNDTTIATTAAINDRIVDLLDDVGGFVPIANETSFPNANPDVNNGTGTLISIKALSSNLTSNGSGVATIANGTVGNSTVTITGLANSTTYASPLGMIVETTTTLNTYAFHRQVPQGTDVSTVAGSISNVNSVASNISNVNTVAGNNTNINTVAGNNSNITTVAGVSSNVTTVAGIASNVTTVANDATDIGTVAAKSTEIGRLGTADAVSDLNTLGTTAIVSDLDTCATNVSNINTVAGSISNVNTVSTNLTSINDFADKYRIASSAPGSNNDDGDLYYNTSDNKLYIYNGSSWDVATALSNSGGTVTGDTTFSDNTRLKIGTGGDLDIYHNGTRNYIDSKGSQLRIEADELRFRSDGGETYAQANVNGAFEAHYDNVKKFETTSWGSKVTGNLEATGSLDVDSVTINGTTVLNSSRSLYNLGTLELADNIEARFGTGSDLKIVHDGSHSRIKDAGTGYLIINTDTGVLIKNGADDEGIAYFTPNGAVELMYDNVKKFETTSDGVTVPIDSGRISVGSTGNLYMHHTGTSGTAHALIQNDYGVMYQLSPDFEFREKGTNDTLMKLIGGGAVELYYDNSKKLETISMGVQITNTTGAAYIRLASNNSTSGYLYSDGNYNHILDGQGHNLFVGIKDGASVLYYDHGPKLETGANGVYIKSDSLKYFAGASDELQVFHNGTDSIIKDTRNAGTVKVQADNFSVVDKDASQTMLAITESTATFAGRVHINDSTQNDDYYLQIHYNPSDKGCIELNNHSYYSSQHALKIVNGDDNNSRTMKDMLFTRNGSEVGSIVLSTTATTYNTSSDYRLKENEVAISDGITRLKTLKPYRFNFKIDSSKTVDGFFAHEVTPAVPEAITGEKDGAEMQGIDQSKLVPLLTAALQEAIAKIETLETKVAALESS